LRTGCASGGGCWDPAIRHYSRDEHRGSARQRKKDLEVILKAIEAGG
jgi:hypothetical protein